MPKHIWTYAAGVSLQHFSHFLCPCNTVNTVSTPPPYVGSDYYCETGYNQAGITTTDILADDPLWDGEQCVGEEAPCCTNNTMPWSNKVLGENTKEDIQLRLCRQNTNRAVLLDLIELFVY